MSVSPRSLTSSAGKSDTHRTGSLWPWMLLIALVIAYAAPWVVGPGAALSFGGYDLAEWSSLPPDVRTQNPPLVTSFLLRLPLAVMTLFIGFAVPYRRFSTGWLITLVALLALVAAQLPPAEFLTSARNDSNYSQQATLAVSSGVIALLGLFLSPWRWRSVFAALFAALGTVTIMAGLLSAQVLLQAYGISASVSAAAWISAGLFILAAIYAATVFVRSWALPSV